jgi:hypothetical protein
LAIHDALPGLEQVRITSGFAEIYIRPGRRLGMYSLPIEAGFFLFAFDHGFDCPLISFEMTLV